MTLRVGAEPRRGDRPNFGGEGEVVVDRYARRVGGLGVDRPFRQVWPARRGPPVYGTHGRRRGCVFGGYEVGEEQNDEEKRDKLHGDDADLTLFQSLDPFSPQRGD